MTETALARSENVFALVGLLSALLTIVLGGFWLGFFVLGTGLIFGAGLFTTDSLMQGQSASAQKPLSRRLLAGAIVAVSYPCSVIILIAVGMLLERLGFTSRTLIYICGMGIAGVFAALAFYWALKLFTKIERPALLQLVLIALSTALISGSADIWGQEFLILSPRFFISPAWASLLIIGETGFAWVWGRWS